MRFFFWPHMMPKKFNIDTRNPEVEAAAFAKSFIQRRTGWGHVFSDGNYLHIEKIAEQAQKAFDVEFRGYAGAPQTAEQATRQRRAEIQRRNGRKIVYGVVVRAAMFHEISQSLKHFRDQEKEVRAKLKELQAVDD